MATIVLGILTFPNVRASADCDTFGRPWLVISAGSQLATYFDGWTKPVITHPIARIAPHGIKNPNNGKNAIRR